MSYLETVRKTKAQLKKIPVPVDDDPILALEDWNRPFRDFHHAVVRETPDFDYLWLRANAPDHYSKIKALENQIDELGPARLSVIIGIMREWRELMLKAQFERKRRQASK